MSTTTVYVTLICLFLIIMFGERVFGALSSWLKKLSLWLGKKADELEKRKD